MNAVEIADAVAQLVEQPFDPAEYPYAFLEAFGNKGATIARLRKRDSNASDLPNGVLQKNNIHLAVCEKGGVKDTFDRLKASPRTASGKAKFILASDGDYVEAEELKTGEPLACSFAELADHFGFFLPLAGISTIKEIKDNPIDVRATGRLNKLYVELLRTNADWQSEERRTDLNHFFARLIFCFFAEDTHIFNGEDLFTQTIRQMTEADGGNVDFVLSKLFSAMNLSLDARKRADLPAWADQFPYVNGGLFSDDLSLPRFTRTARSYLLRAGELNWRQINPDIFGSMIQAVADDEERGALGMHYTSVPNILKVLNPLFLDDLRAQLEKAGDHKASLLKLRERMSRIRVFDPACGSGNFLVIAYKEMRKIEAEINRRRGEEGRRSDIPPTNFRGIEIRDFAAEVARLALVIAEYQCDVLYMGEQKALMVFLPLSNENWIWKGNALRLDWATVCEPRGLGVEIKTTADDLFSTPLQQSKIDFRNEGGETYICGNPPYKGRNKKGDDERADTEGVFAEESGSFASLDYVANWLYKAAKYASLNGARVGLVATNSVCQGEQVALIWPIIFRIGLRIQFAYTSFKWANLASDKAGVTVVIIGLSLAGASRPSLFTEDQVREVGQIGPYLVPGSLTYVEKRSEPISQLDPMYLGNMAKDGGHLILQLNEAREKIASGTLDSRFVRRFYGADELIHARPRACLWISDRDVDEARKSPWISRALDNVSQFRRSSSAPSTQAFSRVPHRFVQMSAESGQHAIIIPRVSSEARPYLPVDFLEAGPVIGDKCYAIYDAELWNLVLIASRLHLIWIGTVCSRLRTDFSYGNKLGWNTFPVPPLTQTQKEELTRCAEDILLAREAHFPATIADLYAPDKMPEDLRRAHDRNDEVLERIYIGRRFKNDTERLEKLFELYTKMVAEEPARSEPRRKRPQQEETLI